MKAWVVFDASGSDETGAEVNVRAVVLDPELAKTLIESPDCGYYKSYEVAETVVMTELPRRVPVLHMGTYFYEDGTRYTYQDYEIVRDSAPLMPHEEHWTGVSEGGRERYSVSGADHDEVRKAFAAEVERRNTGKAR